MVTHKSNKPAPPPGIQTKRLRITAENILLDIRPKIKKEGEPEDQELRDNYAVAAEVMENGRSAMRKLKQGDEIEAPIWSAVDLLRRGLAQEI